VEYLAGVLRIDADKRPFSVVPDTRWVETLDEISSRRAWNALRGIAAYEVPPDASLGRCCT